MKKMLIALCLSVSSFSIAQPLQFDQIGSEPAYCRVYNYQSGNGVIFASVQGGTPDYTFLLTNLSTGANTANSTWGGLNPGDYQVKVWDDVGDSIVQIVTVDSINPQASFDVVSDGLSPQGNNLYWGEAAVDVDFINTSTGVTNPSNPNGDTAFFWKMTQFQDFYQVTSFTTESYSYNYGGTWGVTLVAINKNGCLDTAKAHIWLNGTVGLQELETENTAWLSDNQIQVQMQNKGDYDLLLLDLNGKLIKEEKFSGNSISTDFNSTKGMYLVMIKAEGEVKFIKKLVVN